ncbi:MAG TPA: sigma-70 family RNA polymerase sigma factor [Candidatus Acidoferrum sp.]|nr:sigma-70 family RNA polymerase sigma factor [Candidatus Acidoferrum sp.]
MNDVCELPGQTDEQLMLSFCEGVNIAFEQLFVRYRQSIFAFFRRRTSDLPRAEELTQETFIALFRAATRYQPQAPFRSYLFAIAFKILRADRRKQTFRAFFFASPASANQAAAADHNRDEILWLGQALNRLETSDREILLLREFEQLSYSEIASLLKLPLNTVRSRLFRARLALREHLNPAPAKDSVALGELS